MSLQQYQQLYQQHRHDILNERRSRLADHPEPIATTWSLAFQRVQERNAAAADLLRLCAFLAPNAIPEELITEGMKVLTDTRPPSSRRGFSWFGKRKEHLSARSDLTSLATDPQQFNQAIEVLRAYSLLDRNPRTRQLSIHRLVQAVLKDQMNAATEKLWAERTVQVVGAVFPDVEHKTWPLCERLLPHVLLAADMIELHQFVFPAASRLLSQTAFYLEDRARYGEAEPLYERALQIRERQLGGEHPATATSLNNLALLYHKLGRIEDAERLFRQALAIWERVLGPDHPDTATSLFWLAVSHHQRRQYGQAQPLYERALAIYERVLGPDHPDTLSLRGHYASLLRDMEGEVDEEK